MKSKKSLRRVTMDAIKYRQLLRREEQLMRLKKQMRGVWDIIRQMEKIK